MARTLNLGILAHVDAGKTSLTERLLHAAGAIDAVGSVDAGSTQTDTLDLERRRGITIRSAVASFAVGDVTVNLIDTPGHPDFVAEVERALGVLDGAVLVVSAVEGVQAQTRVLARALRRSGVPTVVFVNKVDRAGARADLALDDAALDDLPFVPLGAAEGAGTRAATWRAGLDADRALDAVADHDDAVLAEYVRTGAVGEGRLRAALAALSRRGLLHAVLGGSAVTGAGVDDLLAALPELLPSADGDPDGPLSGRVFKVERGPAGERVASVRLWSGTLRERDRVGDDKVTAVRVVHRGAAVERAEAHAGQVAQVWGLAGVRVGDDLGAPHGTDGFRFSPPVLETVVVADEPGERAALHAALTQLAEQDPLIGLRLDDAGDAALSLYGEVQKEVVGATLAEEFGVAVSFRETTTFHVERPVGVGEAAERMGADGNPFNATVGLRVEPGPEGSGVRFRLGIEPGSLTLAFRRAVEETVVATLGQGLAGWQVTDCTVVLTESGYVPPPPYGWSIWSSSASDFRRLTPLVLMAALRRAGTTVLEPLHTLTLDAPADTLAAVLPLLAREDAVPLSTVTRGRRVVVEGEVPAAHLHRLHQQLPGATRGEGVLESRFARYRPVRGEVPRRRRRDGDPLHREEYLRSVGRQA
ncbi:GTP-binding protein [Isoptericola sp. NPDC057559]|uniref:GTP-binding protein n=1 Tax=Isoptericola sp. NPDC057559 TaxID=3346168 RepID=UPI0036CFDC00